MNHGQDPLELFESWRNGDEESASRLVAEYFQRLVGLASQQIPKNLTHRLEGDDVVQSVFRTFFRRAAEGEFEFADAEDLWHLLARITYRKTVTHLRHHTAEIRDANKEAGDTDNEPAGVRANGPTPEQAMILVELIAELVDGLPTASASILARLLDGQTKTEIASGLRISRQSVYRNISLFRDRLQRILDRENLDD